MTQLWERLRMLSHAIGEVNACNTGRRGERTDRAAQASVADLDDDVRSRLRDELRRTTRCTIEDIILAANLAGAERVEVLTGQGEVLLCLLDDHADARMVGQIGLEVQSVIAVGVGLYIVIGPAWYPMRSYVEHHPIRGVTDDKLADLLARTEAALIEVEATGRNRVEKRRRHWSEMARRLNAEIERRRSAPVPDVVGQKFNSSGLECGVMRLPG